MSLSNQDPGLLHEVDQPISLKGSETVLDQIYLSPISFAFRLRHLPDALWDTEVGLLSEYWDDNIILHTTSGETVKMDTLYMGGLTNPDPSDSGAAYGHFLFRPEWVIDPAEIVSVTICDQTFALK